MSFPVTRKTNIFTLADLHARDAGSHSIPLTNTSRPNLRFMTLSDLSQRDTLQQAQRQDTTWHSQTQEVVQKADQALSDINASKKTLSEIREEIANMKKMLETLSTETAVTIEQTKKLTEDTKSMSEDTKSMSENIQSISEDIRTTFHAFQQSSQALSDELDNLKKSIETPWCAQIWGWVKEKVSFFFEYVITTFLEIFRAICCCTCCKKKEF